MKHLLAIALSVVTLLLVTGLSSQVNAEEILGCYNIHHGQLRVVSDHSQCLNAEDPITLNGHDGTSDDCSLSDIPDLTGTWNSIMEGYSFPEGDYNSGTGVLVIEDQINSVFKGYVHAGEGNKNITGAIVGNQLTINVADQGVIHATLCGDMLTGAVADHNHDEGFGTLRFTAQRD